MVHTPILRTYSEHTRNILWILGTYSEHTPYILQTHLTRMTSKNMDTEEPTSGPEEEESSVQEPTPQKENEDTSDENTPTDEDNEQPMTEEDAIMDEYLNLANLPNPPRRIPKQHVKDFVTTVERLSKTFLKKKDLRSLFDIIRLPKTIFDPFLTQRRTNLIRRALRDFPNLETATYDAEGRKRYIPKDEGPQGKIRRAKSYFQDGFLSKAMQALLSTKKPVTITTEIYLQMQKLFPEHDLDDGKVQYSIAPQKPDEEDIMRAVKKMNLESSGGPSGWNNRHIKVALRSPSFVKFLVLYSGMLSTGEAPGRDIMTVSDGIALAEPNETDPGKIRPISMGEVIFKLCAKTACHKNRKHGDLKSTQYGNGTMGGAEPVIKLKKQWIMDTPEYSESFIDADRSNAYGTMEIKNIRESLAEHNPENGPLFEWCYGKVTRILLKTTNGRKIMLWIKCLRQGDPNAGYFYQSGDRKRLEALENKLGGKSIVTSYFDDVTVFNKKRDPDDEEEENEDDEDKESPMEAIMNTLPNINVSKTKKVTPNSIKENGYETLGGFIGTREARRNHLKKKIQEFKHAVDQLRPLQKQAQLVLLRQCIVPRLNHLMRNMDPSGCDDLYQQIKRVIAQKVHQLVETPIQLNLRDTRRGYAVNPTGYTHPTRSDLISLPLRYGGLGLSDPQAQSKIAWQASQEKNKWILDKWFGEPTTRPPKQQKHRMEDYWQRASNNLLTSIYRPSALRISVNAEKSSSAWMSTIPTTKDLLLSDDDVKRGLKSRLLLTSADKIHPMKRRKVSQIIINEFKAAEYEAVRISQNTQYTTPEDPNTWASDSVVEPMAISVSTFNITNTAAPDPPRSTRSYLKYYQRKVHEEVTKLQQKKVRSRHYEGYTHFPIFLSPSGSFLGKTRKWIKEMKQRSRLNKTPSAITQLVSIQCIKSIY